MVCTNTPRQFTQTHKPSPFTFKALIQTKLQGILFKPAIFGAYSELFAGLSPDVQLKHNGGFIIPRGRHAKVPDRVSSGLKTKEEGGTGLSMQFWDWCYKETTPYFQ